MSPPTRHESSRLIIGLNLNKITFFIVAKSVLMYCKDSFNTDIS